MNFIKNYWKSILWIVIVFVLSAISGNELNKIPRFNIPHLDKIVHFGMYSIMSFVLLFDRTKIKKINLVVIIIVFVFSTTYGGIMELMQEYVFSKRSMEFMDFVANTSGALIGVVGFAVVSKKIIR